VPPPEPGVLLISRPVALISVPLATVRAAFCPSEFVVISIVPLFVKPAATVAAAAPKPLPSTRRVAPACWSSVPFSAQTPFSANVPELSTVVLIVSSRSVSSFATGIVSVPPPSVQPTSQEAGAGGEAGVASPRRSSGLVRRRGAGGSLNALPVTAAPRAERDGAGAEARRGAVASRSGRRRRA
jgi:hypothetical protein